MFNFENVTERVVRDEYDLVHIFKTGCICDHCGKEIKDGSYYFELVPSNDASHTKQYCSSECLSSAVKEETETVIEDVTESDYPYTYEDYWGFSFNIRQWEKADINKEMASIREFREKNRTLYQHEGE